MRLPWLIGTKGVEMIVKERYIYGKHPELVIDNRHFRSGKGARPL